MPNNIITSKSTKLGSLEDYYSEVHVDDSTSVGGDISLVIVSKLLLNTRVNPDEDPLSVKLWKSRVCYDKDSVTPENERNVFADHVFYDNFSHNNVNITELGADTNDPMYIFILEMTDKHINKKTNRHFERNTAAELFIEQKASIVVRVYIDKETNQSIVVTPRLNFQSLHLIGSLLPVLLPKSFSGDKALTEWERNLLNALILPDSSKFIALVDEYADTHNIRDERIKKLLTGFTKSFTAREIINLKGNIASAHNNIESYYKSISNYYIELGKYEDRLRVLMERAGTDESEEENEIIDFITLCKDITLTSVIESSMTMLINTPLRNFDLDLIERYFETERSLIHNISSYYPNGSAIYPVDTCAKLVKAIMLDNTLDVMMSGSVTLDFGYENVMVNPIRPSYNDNDNTVHNPHLTYYTCLGGNRQSLSQALHEHNYIDAISICVSAVGNVNIGETTNLLNFLRDLFRTRGRVIVRRSDNESMTVDEAIAWLEEEDNEQTN